MALGEGLGRLFDVEPALSQKSGTLKGFSLKDAAGATVVCWVPGNNGDIFTITNSGAHAGTYTAFNPVTRYYTKATLDGTSQWVDSGDLTSNVGTFTISSGSVAFYIGADDLPAGSMYVEVQPSTSGIVTVIMHDLEVQRNPKYLRAPNS
jgi:hypothetical protein